MRKSFLTLQSKLNEKDYPVYPSILPAELRTKDMDDSIMDLYNQSLIEAVKNEENVTLLIDYIGIARKADLNFIEEILKNVKTEQTVCGCNKTPTIPENEFKTAKGESLVIKKQKITEGESNVVDQYILERMKNEILDTKLDIKWEDVVGLENVKKNINEIVLWPMLRPDIFKGLRGPPKGLMLFGPPGTGKTMIGKCIASQVKATFFTISASSLTSKWVGEGEKMVRALFHLARTMQPSVIFVDEIDSLLSQRSDNENEASRRIKTEFLVQFDGIGTSENDQILLIGATNRPTEIDEAARRRLVKRIYVPLPENEARKQMILNLIKDFINTISEDDFKEIALLTEGYSGSDIFNLCREASLEPLREINDIKEFDKNNDRPININDFIKAMKQIRRSVSSLDLKRYEEWNEKYGSTY